MMAVLFNTAILVGFEDTFDEEFADLQQTVRGHDEYSLELAEHLDSYFEVIKKRRFLIDQSLEMSTPRNRPYPLFEVKYAYAVYLIRFAQKKLNPYDVTICKSLKLIDEQLGVLLAEERSLAGRPRQ